MPTTQREKIAIVGGGMSGLCAAHELSRTPELRARYEVTLYQLGWRLGGKLASGRDPDRSMRSTEHGLHVWFGFYDNAFAVFREVFDRWERPAGCPWSEWRDAFLPQRLTPVGEEIDGELGHWDVVWPVNADEPGRGGVLLSPWGVVTQLFSLLVELIHGGLSGDRALTEFDGADVINADAVSTLPEDDHAHSVGVLPPDIEERYVEAVPILEGGPDAVPFVAGAERTLGDLYAWIRRWLAALGARMGRLADAHFHGIIHLLHTLKRVALALLADRDDVDARRLRNIIEIGVAFLCGLLNPHYRIWRSGGDLDRINHLEFRAWLIENGAAKDVVDSWSALRAVYDAFFQYRGGDLNHPDFEAGTAARVFLRTVFTYKGHVLYLLVAGMGETVIGPMYEVLRAQGVRFEFFHKLRGVTVAPRGTLTHVDAPSVTELVFERQAEIAGGADYRPTFVDGGLVCWPSQPLWDQLVDGDQLRAAGVDFESHWSPHRGAERRLRRGVDFDRVISAIDLSSFKPLNDVDRSIFADVLAHSPRLRALAEALPMIPSVAAQLWMRPTLEDLGWTAGRPAMVTWAYPQDVWADMSAVLAHESWGDVDPPRSLHYLTGVWGAPTDLYARPSTAADTPRLALDDVTRRTYEQLDRHVASIWPKAVASTGGFDRALVRDVYLRANIDPAECCVGSPTDTAHLRPRADESGVDGLILAGNWVRSGVNSTCVEQATMTGLAAARAITGLPREIVGEYFLAAGPGTAPAPRPRPQPQPAPQPQPQPAPGPAPRLPAYISSVGHGEQVMLPPGQVKRGRLYAFAVPADRHQLSAYARRYLAEPTGGALDFSAIAPYVLCTYLRSDALTSTAEEVGTISDRECALWIVLVERPRGAARPRLVFWMPYIIIDTSIGMATGREIWGFRKEVGAVRVPAADQDPARFVGEATIFRTLQTLTRGRQEPLIRVERDAPLGPLERAWSSVEDVGLYFAERLLGGAEAWASRWARAIRDRSGADGWSPTFRPSITTVNLKQFRDAAAPDRACYQSIVASPLQITKIRGGGPLRGDYWLRITRCESHQIVADLGLAGEESRVAFAAWLDVDMLALAGEELWRART